MDSGSASPLPQKIPQGQRQRIDRLAPQCEWVPPRRLAGETLLPDYEVVFFLVDFFIMGLGAVALPPFAKQSCIAAD